MTKLLEMKAQMSGSEFNSFITNIVKKMLKRNEREGMIKVLLAFKFSWWSGCTIVDIVLDA
jgi:hypothetical protein